jgi:hypothetical protein
MVDSGEITPHESRPPMAATSFRPSPYSANFQHRSNKDGTCDSVCLRCYRTVAISERQAGLAHDENLHTCTILDLHAWMSDRARSRF